MSPWKCRFVTDGGGSCLKPWSTHDISGSHWKQGNDTCKEPRNRGKKGANPFVPVTPLALMCSQRHGSCGKLNPCSPVMFVGDRWVVFLRVYWCIFSSDCICVCCAVYSQPAVPIWWSYLGSIMSPAGVLFRVVTLAPTALQVIRNHLQQAYPKRTTAVKGVARSEQSLRGFYWFPHLRASLLLLITNQGTASRSRLWATGAQLEQLAHWQAACIVGEELCRLFRETSQWLRLYIIL